MRLRERRCQDIGAALEIECQRACEFKGDADVVFADRLGPDDPAGTTNPAVRGPIAGPGWDLEFERYGLTGLGRL